MPQTPRDLKGRRAISYARWSSGRQTDGDSLRRQTEGAQRFCTTYGLTLDQQLIDGGVSAYTGANLEASLGKFISDVKAGVIPSDTVLLLENLDRFTRTNPMEAVPTLISVLNTGLTLVTLHDGRVHTRADYTENGMSLMMSLMSMQANHEFSAKLSRRISESWKARASYAQRGRIRLSKVPYWIDQQTQELNDRADVAIALFEMSKSGMGQRAIAVAFNAQGTPSPSGGTWSKSSVQDTLDSVAAYGSLKIKGEEVRDYFPALISETEWLAIQQRNKARTRNPQAGTTTNLFPRLTRCGHCGSPMAISSTNARGRIWRYLRCQGNDLKRTECSASGWRYDIFEDEFLNSFGLLTIPFEDTPEVDRTGDLEDAAKELERRRQNVLAGVEEADTMADRKVLLASAARLSDEIAEKNAEITRLRESVARHREASETTFDIAAAHSEVLRLARDDRRKAQELISNFVERIDIESDGPGRDALRRFTVTTRTGRSYSRVVESPLSREEPA